MSNIFDLFKQIEKKDTPAAGNLTHLVVGLGNPGDKYTFTRHNTGFMALDFIAEKCGVRVDRARFKSLCADARIGEHRVLLMKPQTFMNLSGEAVREAADFYKIPPENILVLFDDINFDVGVMRIRRNGSDGGHNGIKSIIYQLNSDAFPRVKIGVGKKPSPDYDLADYVLGTYSDADKKTLFSMFSRVYDGVELILSGQIDKAMNLYNR
ncbi:MAG: aminoacyl-tRNA hydrolase [Oscillospiraceae bacterium]|jgi:PTH1 family peptidyl-tRNA hydrolase|nr:MAG: aminoacyl-tRNA hydrolase [Oscillospiraceae bacterium]